LPRKTCQENSEEYVKKMVHVVILREKVGEKISANIVEGHVQTATPCCLYIWFRPEGLA